jgi:TonB-linked SusC/RagA family outer membrane protein
MKKIAPPKRSNRAKALLKFLLVMKLAILLTLFTAYQVQAGVFGQTVSIYAQKTEIKKILNSIERNGDVRFLYNYELPSLKMKVDFAANNLPLRAALDKLFASTGLVYKILDNNLVVVLKAGENSAESPILKIAGKVTGENNEPLGGVSVLIKGTNKGTSTDNSGIFSLSVDKGAVLIVSYIGYETKEVQVKNEQLVNVQLTVSNKILDQVVVIGYGTQKKSVVTGAITSIKSSDIENMGTSRLEQSLQGRTSGITIAASSGAPGAAATLRIRGTTSINNSDALYMLDGVPIDILGLDLINQSDIESIEVLKDASAAIYGAKAASGVVLITTKKGKAGKLQLSYNGYYGTQAPARKLKLLNATQYATLRNESVLAVDPTKPLPFANPSALGTGTDWQSAIFNNDARIQDHQLSLSAGSEKSTFFGSFGYFSQDGIVATSISNYKRFNIRLNSTHKIKDWLSFGENFAYSYIKSQGSLSTNSEFGGPLSSAINLDPITPLVITDPTVLANAPYSPSTTYYPYIEKDPNGHPYGMSPYVIQEMSNPLAYMQTQQGNYGWSHNMVGNTYFEIEPIKGLKFRSNIGAKLAFYGSTSFTPLFYLSTIQTNLINTTFYKESNQGFSWIWDNTVTYTKSINLHNFSILAGTSAQEASGSKLNVNYIGLLVPDFNSASFNYTLPALVTTGSGTSASTVAVRPGSGSESQPYTLSSLFGRVTYDYDQKYLFTGIIRQDGSSKFGSNKKYGVFPSASAGWVASREKFWPSNNVVSFLKIRGSYGLTGNEQSLGTFQYVSTIGGGDRRNYPIGSNVSLGNSPNALANPDLKWEQTTSTDLGLEASLFKHFNLNFDWFIKNTSGMLMVMPVPGYVGAEGNPTGNVGALNNKGVELELGYTNKIGQLGLNVRGNVSYVKNTITNIGTYSFITAGTFQSSSYELGRTVVGQPIASFYGFKEIGVFQTQAEINNYTSKTGQLIEPNAKPGDFKFADLDGDGQITTADRTFLGNPTPSWTFGFTVNADWKNFDLVVFGQGVAGNKIFQGLRRLDVANANYSTKALGRWTGTGTSNDYPRLIETDPNHNFTNPSNFYLEDGSYFRIKTLQIGYTIPKSITDKAGLQKLRVYISSNNLVTFTKYTGFDPEIGGTSYSIDRGIYPQARSFMFGLNVIF